MIEIDKADLDRKMNLAINEIAILLTQELAQACPVDTGYLKNSISYKIENDTIVIYMADYADYVEFGTPPHLIKAKNKKALHWKDGNKDVFAKQVNHPGTAPNPFIRNTMMNKFPQIVEAALKKHFS